MRTSTLLTAGWFAAGMQAGAIPPTDDVLFTASFNKRQEASAQALQGKILQADVYAGIAGLNQQNYQSTKKPLQWEKCNTTNVVVRREWSTFSTSEKKNYIASVQCLSKLPPKTPKEVCPGCRNRFDDFLATHIQQTYSVHITGNFLSWHRWFMYAYEKTLRDECGYQGQHPYYNWPQWSDNPMESPALDGSDTSMSGNGVLGCTNQTSYGIPLDNSPLINIPKGTGGGCVATGPFKDWPVNLGPVFPGLSCTPANPISNASDPRHGLGYNPRCLKRDISSWTSSQWSNDEQVTKLLNSSDMKTFWYNIQDGQNAFSNNFMGVHTAGHFTVGGDPGSDFFASPGDPWFYFHHAQIDRVWWTWQNLHPANRTTAIYGTTYFSDPSAPQTRLNDTMTLGYAFPGTMTVGEAASTMGGPFCYTYI